MLLLPLLAGCTDVKDRILCGRVTPMEVYTKEDNFFKEHKVYSVSLFQLKIDPPEECRDDWHYDLVVAPDRLTFKFIAVRISKPEKWVVDEKGVLDEAPAS